MPWSKPTIISQRGAFLLVPGKNAADEQRKSQGPFSGKGCLDAGTASVIGKKSAASQTFVLSTGSIPKQEICIQEL
jgi:hypothetical protein